jgi:outer membrane lipoprotein-sorting protein
VVFGADSIPHHGEVITANPDFVLACKAELTKKLKFWQKEAVNITSFEIYDNDRNVLFNWGK